MTTNLRAAQKATLVVLGLEEAVAVQLLRQLDERDLRRLVEVIDEFENMPSDALVPVLVEFEEQMGKPLLPTSGGDYLRKLTAHALGEGEAERVFAPPGVTLEAIDKLRNASPKVLAEVLEKEHPQVVAVVLAQLPRSQAASVLAEFEVEQQLPVVQRLSRISEIQASGAAVATEAIAEALGSAGIMGPGPSQAFDGLTFAAGMLNSMPTEVSEELMDLCEDEDEDLVPKLREAMFTFEDLADLDSRSLQTLMREIGSDKLVIALKTASSQLRDAFLSAVSSRAAETIREDLELMAPRRLSEVEEAQRDIVNVALQLASDGRVVLPSSEELV